MFILCKMRVRYYGETTICQKMSVRYGDCTLYCTVEVFYYVKSITLRVRVQCRIYSAVVWRDYHLVENENEILVLQSW